MWLSGILSEGIEMLTKPVWLVGAHSTGKSTLARWVSREYFLPIIPETARALIGDLGRSLDEIRLDPDASDKFQWDIFERQLAAEKKLDVYVSDRGCDHLAYAAEHSRMAPFITADPRFDGYVERMRAGVVFFVRPHRELLKADGVRAGLDWDCVVRIDAMVKFILKAHGVPFVELASREMDARISTIRAVLGRAPGYVGVE